MNYLSNFWEKKIFSVRNTYAKIKELEWEEKPLPIHYTLPNQYNLELDCDSEYDITPYEYNQIVKEYNYYNNKSYTDSDSD
tara:strand:- start:99 stop:341 length:243 start_codon:yes stop_codon:yes gene_type:complete